LRNLDKLGLNSLSGDDFYEKMLEYMTHPVLCVLKDHSRIPVPGSRTLVGVTDTHRYLQEDEIFVCVKPISGGRRYVSGRVPVSRSPTIHSGEVRIVHAIRAPPTGPCFEEEPLVFRFLATVVSCAGADGGQGDEDVDEDMDKGPSMV
jgi:hypothetical protein